jgi:hypothetical protein
MFFAKVSSDEQNPSIHEAEHVYEIPYRIEVDPEEAEIILNQ